MTVTVEARVNDMVAEMAMVVVTLTVMVPAKETGAATKQQASKTSVNTHIQFL